MSEESGQIVIELAVDNFKIVLEVGGEVLHVVEYFLKVFLDDSEDPRQLDVAEPRYYVVGYCVILIANQDRELNVKSLH